MTAVLTELRLVAEAEPTDDLWCACAVCGRRRRITAHTGGIRFVGGLAVCNNRDNCRKRALKLTARNAAPKPSRHRPRPPAPKPAPADEDLRRVVAIVAGEMKRKWPAQSARLRRALAGDYGAPPATPPRRAPVRVATPDEVAGAIASVLERRRGRS